MAFRPSYQFPFKFFITTHLGAPSSCCAAWKNAETDFWQYLKMGHAQLKTDFPQICFFAGFPNPSKGASMKKTLIRFILIAAALLAMSATTAMADGGGPAPLCWPGKPC
jgi:hypothetical protein